eukprot:2928664-Prymnesium_polylepis.1
MGEWALPNMGEWALPNMGGRDGKRAQAGDAKYAGWASHPKIGRALKRRVSVSSGPGQIWAGQSEYGSSRIWAGQAKYGSIRIWAGQSEYGRVKPNMGQSEYGSSRIWAGQAEYGR